MLTPIIPAIIIAQSLIGLGLINTNTLTTGKYSTFSSPTTISDSNTTSTITVELQNQLVYLLEEEKLAHDVYIFTTQKWPNLVTPFNNISQSELTHNNAVKSLLQSLNIQTPLITTDLGKFTNPELQSLYNTLISKASISEGDALIVGATIEDMDIKDLNNLASKTTNQDILRIINKLKSGSENHMRAFVTRLSKYGIDYTPQYISQLEYQTILNSSSSGDQGHKLR